MDTTPTEFRRSLSDRLLIAFAMGFLVLVTVIMTGAAVAVMTASIGLGLFLLALAALMIFLCVLVSRETLARWKTLIRLDAEGVRLILPATRGYARLAPVDTLVPWNAIAEIDTREEAYRSLGMTMMQRAFAVALKDGSRVELGADRPMVSAFFEGVASEIASRSGVAFLDRGTYDAKAGPLAVGGATAPSWSAAPLPEATAQKRRRSAQLTLSLLTGVVLLVVVVRLLTRLAGH